MRRRGQGRSRRWGTSRPRRSDPRDPGTWHRQWESARGRAPAPLEVVPSGRGQRDSRRTRGVADSILAQREKKQNRYERRTDHGAAQGASLFPSLPATGAATTFKCRQVTVDEGGGPRDPEARERHRRDPAVRSMPGSKPEQLHHPVCRDGRHAPSGPDPRSDGEAQDHRKDEDQRCHADEEDALPRLCGERVQFVSFTLHACSIPRWRGLHLGRKARNRPRATVVEA